MRPSPCGRRASRPGRGCFRRKLARRPSRAWSSPTPPPHPTWRFQTKIQQGCLQKAKLLADGLPPGAGGEGGGGARLEASSSGTPEKHLCFPVPWAHLGVGSRQDGPLGLKNIPFPGDGALPAEPFFPGQLLALQREEAGACVGRGETLTPRQHGWPWTPVRSAEAGLQGPHTARSRLHGISRIHRSIETECQVMVVPRVWGQRKWGGITQWVRGSLLG